VAYNAMLAQLAKGENPNRSGRTAADPD